MRALPVLLALCLVPLATATHPEPVPECDIDDDLYNHCHVKNVHWVTGACFGVATNGQPARCWVPRGDLVDPLLP